MIAEPTESRVDVRTLPLPTEFRTHGLGEIFAPIRQWRRDRYAGWRPNSHPNKKWAVQTIVHNEPIFLPIWLRYYSRFFAPADIYVLDNETTDGSTDRDGFARIPVSHDRVDHTWMVRTLEDNQHELLERYDVVLTTDVDEIVAPVPEWGTLGDYLDRIDEEFVSCLGYELLHMRDVEGPLDLTRPIMDQRRYWFANDAYDKPAIATEPMKWKPGLHRREDEQLVLDPDLYMIHLHRMDYGICLERHRLRSERAWNQHDLDERWATHNRITEKQEFDRWFYSDGNYEGDEQAQILLEPIPAAWKGVF